YIAKYYSKAETKSKSYNDLTKEVLPYISTYDFIALFVTKIINKLALERDIFT
ncbi:hypothetical protein QBC39DRAFT_250464, partial [Podospora conica]